uniref:Uncharacterized protein n=1 Tax=Anguilla anguilla TaxID=7936 RepID=A0A0E9W5V1_ANGAN
MEKLKQSSATTTITSKIQKRLLIIGMLTHNYESKLNQHKNRKKHITRGKSILLLSLIF